MTIENTQHADTLAEVAWKTPSDYMGFNPVGDFVIYVRTRDSHLLDAVNYEVAMRELERVARPFGDAPEDGERGGSWVYDFRAGHWACGWVEYLMVRHDAPDEVKTAADEILHALADYPVLDDEAFSAAEDDAMQELWDQLDLRERADYVGEDLDSLFQLRRASPFDLPYPAYETLREAACQ